MTASGQIWGTWVSSYGETKTCWKQWVLRRRRKVWVEEEYYYCTTTTAATATATTYTHILGLCLAGPFSGFTQVRNSIKRNCCGSTFTGTLLLSQERCSLGAGRQVVQVPITVFPSSHESMLSPVRNSVILQCFDAICWATERASRL